MKKLFRLSSLIFRKPRRRRTPCRLSRAETLQTRIVPAAVAGMPVDDASQVEPLELIASDEELMTGDVVLSDETTAEEVASDEVLSEQVPEEWMYFSMASFSPEDGLPTEELAAEEESAEEYHEDYYYYEDYSEGEPEIEYFSDPWYEEEPSLHFTMTTGDVESEGESAVTEDYYPAEESRGEIESVENSGTGEEPVVVPAYYYRTLTSQSNDEGEGSEELSDEESFDEEPVDESVSEEESRDLEIYNLSTSGAGIESEDHSDSSNEEPAVADSESADDDPLIYYTAAGDGADYVSDEPVDVQEPTSTDDETDSGSNPEIRTLSNNAEEVTYGDVVDLYVTEVTSAGDEYRSSLSDQIATFSQLVGLFQASLQQNSRDIAGFAAAGDSAGVQSGLAHNQALIDQYTQIVAAFVNDLQSLAQRYVVRISGAGDALRSADGGAEQVASAASAFNQRHQRLAAPEFLSELADQESGLQELIDSQNSETGEDQGILPGDEQSSDLRIAVGNTQASASIESIGASVFFTGHTDPVSQPADGETVTASVNLTNLDDTLGDEPVFVSGVYGSFTLTGTAAGAVVSDTALTIDGVRDDESFSIDIELPPDASPTVEFDAEGNLIGISGEFTLPADPDLLPGGGVLVLNVTFALDVV